MHNTAGRVRSGLTRYDLVRLGMKRRGRQLYGAAGKEGTRLSEVEKGSARLSEARQ